MSVENPAILERAGTTEHRGPDIGYRLLYFFGFTPWDNGDVAPELVDLVEGPDALPPGRALDLGCSTGTQAIYLAKKGWQVTGVDYVAQALAKARQRAAAAGVAPTWVAGDVTRLSELVVDHSSTAYTLLLDFGCFHGLNAPQCAAYAAGMSAVAAPGATLLLFGFSPGRRGPAPHGISAADVTRYFGDKWELRWARPASQQRLPPFLRRANPFFYRLQRRRTGS